MTKKNKQEYQLKKKEKKREGKREGGGGGLPRNWNWK